MLAPRRASRCPVTGTFVATAATPAAIAASGASFIAGAQPDKFNLCFTGFKIRRTCAITEIDERDFRGSAFEGCFCRADRYVGDQRTWAMFMRTVIEGKDDWNGPRIAGLGASKRGNLQDISYLGPMKRRDVCGL